MNLKDYTDTHTQIALAKSIGAAPSFVNQWVNGGRPVPAAYCVAIERATNTQVTRQELRPDDYWLIWPDLPQSSAALDLEKSDQERRDQERRDADERREGNRRNGEDANV